MCRYDIRINLQRIQFQPYTQQQQIINMSVSQSQKQLHNITQTHQKQKQLLLQQLQFLSQELQQYKQREQDNKKINQSIMITYQQNQNIREQCVQHIIKQLKITKQKYQEQMNIYKEQSQKRCRLLEESVREWKGKYEDVVLEMERKGVEYERKVMEVKRKYEKDLRNQVEEKEKEYEAKIQILKEKLKQAQSMAEVYQQFVQKRRQNYGYYTDPQQQNTQQNPHHYLLLEPQPPQPRRQPLRQTQPIQSYIEQAPKLLKSRQSSYSNISRKDRLRNIEQNNKQDMRRLSASRESVRLLTEKIDRAVVQLKGSKGQKLHQRINQKLMKRLM